MEPKIITTEELTNFINGIIESGTETYGVVDKEPDGAFGKFNYARLGRAENLRLDYDVTIHPPKTFFTPPREKLLNFKLKPEIKVSAVFETNKRVIVGVHPYDMIAINQMDEVWKDSNEDIHYFKRRKNTVIIGVDPQSASSWAFWCLMDAGKVDIGYDVWLTKLDDGKYFMEIATEAGDELVKKFAKATAATDADINRRDHIRTHTHDICNSDRKLKARPGEIPLLVKGKWDSPIWKEKAAKCYSCGSCNLVCPTCYCFDVKEDISLDLKDGSRSRVWDGCQLEDFAAVGSGENFREHRTDRFKHRFYRKTVYQYEKYNHLACVGCGRCSSVCLPNVADPVDIINSLKEEK